MTSPARGGPDTAGVREEIARTLGEAWITSGPRSWEEQSEARRQGARHLADALLPVVQLLAEKELRAAAVCPTPCDEDCDADCHEGHDPRWKRLHQPEHCPSRLLTAAAQPTDGRTGQ